MSTLIPARSDMQFEQIRLLWREYRAEVERRAGLTGACGWFDSFDAELVQLPGEYAPPGGVVLLALGETRVAGTAALRPAGAGVAELRRVYVRSDERGRGHGRALVIEALARARRAGYTRVQLETLDAMSEAIALYESLGFVLTGEEEGVRRYEVEIQSRESGA